MPQSLTVLIPTHGRPVLLGRTLASVAACARPAGYAGCVVVENGPAAGAEAVVAAAARECPEAGFRYAHVARANKSAALNAALEDVAGGLVVFLDDDVRLGPETLAVYAAAAARHPGRAYFGGPLQSDFEARPPDWLMPHLPNSVNGFTLADAARLGYYLGANWAAYAEDVRGLGGFDPNYGPGSPTGARGQETDMQHRMRAAGCAQVDVPDAVVWHYVPASRCSPRWNAHRRLQTGTLEGYGSRMGTGRRRIREACVGVVQHGVSMIAGILTFDPPRRYVSLAAAASDFGYLRGYVYAARDARRRAPMAR